MPKHVIDIASIWPLWLTAVAVARDQNGTVWAYSTKPSRGNRRWLTELGSETKVICLSDCEDMLKISPLMNHIRELPWYESNVVNPNQS